MAAGHTEEGEAATTWTGQIDASRLSRQVCSPGNSDSQSGAGRIESPWAAMVVACTATVAAAADTADIETTAYREEEC